MSFGQSGCAPFESLENRTLLSGGGGTGGGTKPVLPTPAIPPGTFDGIGSGPTYVRESFGFAQGTRYKQNGSITQVFTHTNVNGIRAEYPNNKTETWIGPPEAVNGQEWDFAVVGPSDPYEAYTPLQDDRANGYYSDGILFLNGASFLDGTPDLRPNGLLPFAAPTGSAYTVSGDSVGFFGKTAIGFTSSGSVNRNFETSGQAWLEINSMGNFPAGAGITPNTFEFHTNGLSGASVSGTFTPDPTGFNRLAVSYDPVNHVAAAMLNGGVVAQLPYTATSAIKYVGVEGSYNGNIDNFAVATGAIAAAPAAPSLARTSTSSSSIRTSGSAAATSPFSARQILGSSTVLDEATPAIVL